MNAPVNRFAASAYEQVGLETGVSAASPHKLISMLFEGAIQALNQAAIALSVKDLAGKGALIGKAISIIDEGLGASLDMKAGGELANNLAALYDYMVRRLLTANLRNDAQMLREVTGLLAGLKEAWDAIGDQKAPAAAATPAAAPEAPPAAPVTPQAMTDAFAARVATTYGRV